MIETGYRYIVPFNHCHYRKAGTWAVSPSFHGKEFIKNIANAARQNIAMDWRIKLYKANEQLMLASFFLFFLSSLELIQQKQFNQASPQSVVMCCPALTAIQTFLFWVRHDSLPDSNEGENDWPDDDEVSTRGDHHTLVRQRQDYRVMMRPRLCKTRDCMGVHGMTSPSTVR